MGDRIEPQIPLGEAVRMMRERKRLSKTTVASRAGISARWIEDVEAGKSNPTWANLRRLVLGLSVELTELMTLVELAERRHRFGQPEGAGASSTP
jgi:transcriptional regulator with XRE-family HTH domain